MLGCCFLNSFKVNEIILCCLKFFIKKKNTIIYDLAIRNNKPRRENKIKFVKVGSKERLTQRTRSNHLVKSNDLQMKGDIRKQLKFPERIIETSLRPDIIFFFFFSNKEKSVNYIRINHRLGREYIATTWGETRQIPGIKRKVPQ